MKYISFLFVSTLILSALSYNITAGEVDPNTPFRAFMDDGQNYAPPSPEDGSPAMFSGLDKDKERIANQIDRLYKRCLEESGYTVEACVCTLEYVVQAANEGAISGRDYSANFTRRAPPCRGL